MSKGSAHARSVWAARAVALALAMPSGARAATIVPPQAGSGAWRPAAVAKLDADLDAMLAASPAVRSAHVGIYAIDTASGAVLYAHHADEAFQPASTLKLVVGSAALDTFGGAFHFHAVAYAHGDELLLSGAYDPTLDARAFAEAASAWKASGRSSASGVDVAVDDASYPEGWTWDDFGQTYAPLVTSTAVNESVVRVTVTPSEPGAPATVATDDAARLVDSNATCDAALTDRPAIVSLVTTGARNSEDTVDVREPRHGCTVIAGSIPLGAPDSVGVSVDPRFYVRATLANALTNEGVTVSAPIRLASNVAGAPPEAVVAGDPIVWSRDSAPLQELLGPRFWIPSDNLFGEMLLRRLTPAPAAPSTAGGIAAEMRWLQAVGVDPASVTLADGCGMSQYDRITPHDLVTILQHDWNGPNRQVVLDSLPVGGARGTIEGIAGTPAAGRVFAKTGSMMHVRGLAGYLATQHHGAVTFAFSVDDWLGEYPALGALRASVLTRIIDDAG